MTSTLAASRGNGLTEKSQAAESRFKAAWSKITKIFTGRRTLGIDVLPGWMFGRPQLLPPEQIDFPYAYKLVPTVYACVNVIQSTIAGLPLTFYRGRGQDRTEVDREPGNLPDLWSKANAEDTGYELVESIVGSLCIFGNAYLYLETQGTDQITELKVLGGNDVTPIPGPRGTVAGYEYRPQGSFGANRVVLAADRILHFRDYNPFATGLGLSPMHAAQLSYETERDSQRYQRSFYQGGAQVAGTYSTEEVLDKVDIDRIKEDLVAQGAGIENFQKPVILIGGLKYLRAGLTQSEMQFMESSRLTSAEIMKIFRIPPVIMGVKEGGGLSDAGASTDMLLFWEQCIKPRLRRIEAVLNEKLIPRFDASMQCEFDLAKVAVYQEVFLDQAQAYMQATGAPIMSRAEARERLDLPEMTEDAEELEKLLAPVNLIPVGTEPLVDPPATDGPVGDQADEQDAEQGDEQFDEAASRHERRLRTYLRRQAARDMLRFERSMRAAVVRFFQDQEARFMDRLAAAAAQAVSRVSLDDASDESLARSMLRNPQANKAFARSIILDDLLNDEEVDRRLVRQLLQAIIQERGQEVVDELASQIVFSSFSQRASDYAIRKSGRLVTQVNNTTRKALAETITEAIDKKEGYSEVLARVREVFSDRRANASTIARTETASAYNFATNEAYDQSGVVEEKEWLSSQDDAVREAHAEADGQVVGIDDSFTLTGEDGGLYDAEYPGDPSLPAELVINCRCTMIPVVRTRARKVEAPSTNGHHPAVSLEELFR